MSKEFVKFCNTLRCPVCGAQLDGNVSIKSAILYCVSAPDEYRAHYSDDSKDPNYEKIEYVFGYDIYTVTLSSFGNGTYSLDIVLTNGELMPMYRGPSSKVIISTTINQRFTIQSKKLDKEAFMKKLKIYSLIS